MSVAVSVVLGIAAHNLSVLPVQPGDKKPAIKSWAVYQMQAMSRDAINQYFTGRENVAVICGACSGGLEVIDFDTLGSGETKHFDEWKNLVMDNGFEELLNKLPVVMTPSGGFHIYYRCGSSAMRNRVLASCSKPVNGKSVLIETRGQGGYVVAPPSPGYRWLSGNFDSIPTISEDERDALIMFAKALDQAPPTDVYKYERTLRQDEQRPGDKYNEEADIRDLLRGWDYLGKSGHNQMWRRPGKKERSPSATFHELHRTFYVHTSSVPELQSGRAYSLFSLYVAMEHGGNVNSALRALCPPKTTAPRTTSAAPVKHSISSADALFESSSAESFDTEEIRFGIFGKYLRAAQINLLDAPSFIGKTRFILGIAAAGSKGIDLFDDTKIEPFRTLYFTTEDSGGDLNYIYQNYRPNPGYLEINSKVLDLRGDILSALERKIVSGGFKFIVFDPLLTYMYGLASTNDNKAVNEYLVGLRDIAMRTGACILNIRHFGKGSTLKDLGEKGSGAAQFANSHRSQLVMCWHPVRKGLRVVFHARGSLRVPQQEPFGIMLSMAQTIDIMKAEHCELKAFGDGYL